MPSPALPQRGPAVQPPRSIRHSRHGRPVAQRKPEPGGRVDERATDPQLVACLPKERQRLLEERLSPGVLPMRADLLCQWEEGLGNFPWLAHLPQESHLLFMKGDGLDDLASPPGSSCQ